MTLEHEHQDLGGSDHLSFLVGSDPYCVDIRSVREIRGWSPVTPLPHAPDFMRGVVNLRGTVLPIIDLSKRLGKSLIEQNDRSVIIVVERDDDVIGLAVTAVSDILPLEEDEFQPPPTSQISDGPSFLKALVVRGEELLKVIDLAVLLPSNESPVGSTS